MTHTGRKNTKRSINSKTQPDNTQDLFVIGVGASAGGLQAFSALFSAVPNDSVSYVIVQHLSAQHISMLTELVSEQTILRVEEAQDNMPVVVNRVYVIPNNKELIIKNNRLYLHDKDRSNRSETVDTFFKSLAADKGFRAIGIILSGNGTDGTEGIVAIKKAGGMVIVQDPATARNNSMPLNAMNTGYADFVVPPEEMPAEIMNYVKVAPIANRLSEQVMSNSETAVLHMLEMIHERTGIDFSNYKMPTIVRRISRRMAFNEINNLHDYLDFLNLNPAEIEILSKEFLIGVTKFFRDQEAYSILGKKVIPVLVDSKKVTDQLRVWVAGCSTGEEAYSIAILLREYMDKVKKELEVKIFASDIDRDALEFAGKGCYQSSSLENVSEEKRNEYFIIEEGKYRVNQRVRRMVIFAPHNVINDPPFSRIDLVSCRNMLIYLNQPLQKKVIDKFHYGLLVGGYLFLGSSESIGEQKSFAEVSKKWKIYRNIDPKFSIGIDAFGHNNISKKVSATPPLSAFPRDPSARQVLENSFNDLLSETILEESGYAAIYIDENFDVLHGAGKFKNYIDLPEHNFTFNLLKLVSPDLSASLATLLRKAIRTREKIAAYNMPIHFGSGMHFVNVVVKPYLDNKKLSQNFILVLFNDNLQMPVATTPLVTATDTDQDLRVQELEIELQHTKEDLQAVVEELETSNEELQSTNEELLSSNEELQSTNEELQSLNEELHTINTEHQYKIKALMELDDDLNNYFRSTDIGQIFVDRKLSIRKFTPAATNLINLIESDIGRSIYQISNNLRYDLLIEDIRHVIGTTKTIEKEVQDKNGQWYQMRILPYITQESKIDGAIVIFIQINELKNLHLLHEGILDSSPNAVMALKAIFNRTHTIIDFAFTILNHKAQEFLNRSETELLEKSLWKEYPSLLQQGMFEKFVHVVQTGEHLHEEQSQNLDGETRWLHLDAVKFNNGLVLTIQDITERKNAEKVLQQQQLEIKSNAERFRTLLEAIPNITWTNKLTGENETFNDVWYTYTGLSKEESVGWGWTKAFHPDDLESLILEYKNCLKTGEVHTGQARIFNKAENRYRLHLIKDVPIRDEQGKIMLWIGTATDIQEQKDADETNVRLRLSQQREILKAILKTQEAERDRISEALHNGLGQILYAAKLNLANMTPMGTEERNIKEKVDILLKESIAVTRHISAELTPNVLKDFGLPTAIEESISRLRNHQLQITSEITGFSERLDYTAELAMYRIIQELLNNIVKHSKATQASVYLVREGNDVILKVEDNGIGIDKKELQQLKGIGLNSIQNRIKLLEGKFSVDSTPHKGTVFTIAFQL